jgi:hypothetical protein
MMSGGHGRQNTIGGHSESLLMMMPPMPWLEVLTTPMKSGHQATSLQQRVGWLVDSCRIVCQLEIAEQMGSFQWKYTTGGRCFRRWLHSESRPQPPGRAVNAYLNFATMDSNSTNGTPHSQSPAWSQLCRMVRSFALLSSFSHIIFLLDVKIKTKERFEKGILSFTFHHFFSNIGLLPSPTSARNTLWMPVINALVTCSN